VIKEDGTITQFVKDTDAAHHAGIPKEEIELYNRNDNEWKRWRRDPASQIRERIEHFVNDPLYLYRGI
jgi:predicted DNA-binding protein